MQDASTAVLCVTCVTTACWLFCSAAWISAHRKCSVCNGVLSLILQGPWLHRCQTHHCVQARAYDNILSSYTGVALSNGASFDNAAAKENATAAFEAGQPSFLGFTTSQINGIWASPIGIWRVMSFLFDIVRPILHYALPVDWAVWDAVYVSEEGNRKGATVTLCSGMESVFRMREIVSCRVQQCMDTECPPPTPNPTPFRLSVSFCTALHVY